VFIVKKERFLTRKAFVKSAEKRLQELRLLIVQTNVEYKEKPYIIKITGQIIYLTLFRGTTVFL
jgi:hypothetical protein